jgi:hypothetical protein
MTQPSGSPCPVPNALINAIIAVSGARIDSIPSWQVRQPVAADVGSDKKARDSNSKTREGLLQAEFLLFIRSILVSGNQTVTFGFIRFLADLTKLDQDQEIDTLSKKALILNLALCAGASKAPQANLVNFPEI